MAARGLRAPTPMRLHADSADHETRWPTQEALCVTQLIDDRVLDGVDAVAAEVPVALVYNGISHAVMLATPADLHDFALGFSLSEGIIESGSEIRDVELVEVTGGIEARIEIAAARFVALKERRRSMAGRTGCGLCGVDSLADAVHAPAPVAPAAPPGPAAMLRALAALPERQALHLATGGCHAAAWADAAGQIMLVREDVGRHNALDKLIGAAGRAGIAPDSGFVVVSSRASYEMVHKTARMGAATLVAVSAPTALAVQQARQAGMALFGFARAGRIVCYNMPGA